MELFKLLSVYITILFITFAVPTHAESENNCPSFCTTDYSPLCAKDSLGNVRKFSNSCSMEKNNCNFQTDYEKIHDGEC
ncbi:vasotab-TY2-like [Lycorma delicatula]|uniref:vasotab-TY2-like n=1 Tax=Lycorma delicatula TaxID=130591 RepID=UPI003F514A7A